MKQITALAILTKLKPILVEKYGVNKLCLFGSTARDEASDNSDVDILVSFAGPVTSESYFGVQFLIEDQLGCPVDIVTDKALREEFKPYVLKDAINV